MNESLKKLIVRALKDVTNKIEGGNTNLTEDEAMEIMAILSHEAMSKESACIYLNLSRSRFDELMREGFIPKGRKRVGFKELVWYRDELNEAIEAYRNRYKG